MGMSGWTEEEIEAAKRMYAAGESCRSIGAAIGKHPDTVRYYIRTHIKFFPEPQGKSYIPQGNKALYKRNSRYMRRCHDCGRPTTDYRCPRCWARLRRTGGYSPTEEVSDMDKVAYGPAQLFF